MHRQIDKKLLLINTIIYRTIAAGVQIVFFGLLTGEWKWATGVSLAWNVVNTALYYVYNYVFFTTHRIGKNGK